MSLALIVAGVLISCSAERRHPPTASSVAPTATPTPSSIATPTPDQSESPGAIATPEPTGPCANDYLPVVPGLTWTYERTVGTRVSRYRQRVEELGPRGFSLLLFEGAAERQIWTCSPEGLANIEQQITGENGGPPPPGTIWFHYVSSRGVTVPADPSVGSSWKQVVRSRTVFTAGGVDYPEQQVVTTSYQVLGEEAVETLAGTFQALKIDTRSTTHKTAPSFGNGLDQTTTVRYAQWWVRGVGMVMLMGGQRLLDHDRGAGQVPRANLGTSLAPVSCGSAAATEIDPRSWRERVARRKRACTVPELGARIDAFSAACDGSRRSIDELVRVRRRAGTAPPRRSRTSRTSPSCSARRSTTAGSSGGAR